MRRYHPLVARLECGKVCTIHRVVHRCEGCYRACVLQAIAIGGRKIGGDDLAYVVDMVHPCLCANDEDVCIKAIGRVGTYCVNKRVTRTIPRNTAAQCRGQALPDAPDSGGAIYVRVGSCKIFKLYRGVCTLKLTAIHLECKKTACAQHGTHGQHVLHDPLPLLHLCF